MEPGVAIVKARAIGQDDQQVGLHQINHQPRQGVVVAEADLVGGHGVVLVHHRHDAEPQQGTQGAAGVQVTLTMAHIVVRQ